MAKITSVALLCVLAHTEVGALSPTKAEVTSERDQVVRRQAETLQVVVNADGSVGNEGSKIVEQDSDQMTRREDGVVRPQRTRQEGSDFAVSGEQSDLGTSTSYCYQENSALGDCWSQKPSNAPACDALSGTTICRCGQDLASCDMAIVNGISGRCTKREVYVLKGKETDRGRDVDVQGTGEEFYCKEMVKLDQWKQNGLLAPNDSPESKSKPWLGICGWGYTSRDGKCHRKKRYLGESCWGSAFGGGECERGENEYRTACYEGKCVVQSYSLQRKQCSCSWFGWNFLVVCSAKDDACDGHACVWNTGAGAGQKYGLCDYGNSQNWNTLGRLR